MWLFVCLPHERNNKTESQDSFTLGLSSLSDLTVKADGRVLSFRIHIYVDKAVLSFLNVNTNHGTLTEFPGLALREGFCGTAQLIRYLIICVTSTKQTVEHRGHVSGDPGQGFFFHFHRSLQDNCSATVLHDVFICSGEEHLYELMVSSYTMH